MNNYLNVVQTFSESLIKIIVHILRDIDYNKRSYKNINMYTLFQHHQFQHKNKCGGWDSNPWTPSRRDPKSSAFDLAG
ncbi:MAG: hypothetical protein KAT05_06560, partial [Spirochaetes bacterium]|nr:hypothetical protein [Spirochaetota bacterium]